MAVIHNLPRDTGRLTSVVAFSLLLMGLGEAIAVFTGAFTHPQSDLVTWWIALCFGAVGISLIWSLWADRHLYRIGLGYGGAVVLVATILFWAGNYFSDSQTYNVTVVEENQGTVFPTESINRWAAEEQQPPTDYFNSQFTQKIFGKNRIGLRIKNLVSTFFLLGLVLSLSIYLTGSWIVSLGATLLFIQNPFLHYHLWHARPLTLALAHYAIVVGMLLTTERKWPLPLMASAFFLLLMSCGLQPMIGLFTAVVVWMVIKPKNQGPKAILTAAAIATLGFLPSLFQITYLSFELDQFHSQTSVFFKSVSEIFSRSTWDPFFVEAFALPQLVWPVLVVVAMLFRKSLASHSSTKFLALNWMLFSVTFVVVFKVAIDYPMLKHYFLLSHLNAVLLFTSVLGMIAQRFFKPTVLALIAVVIIPLSDSNAYPRPRVTPAHQKSYNAQMLFKTINEVAGPEDHVYIISLQKPGIPSRTRFVGKSFYEENQHSLAPQLRPPTAKPIYEKYTGGTWRNDNFLIQDIRSQTRIKNLVFVHLQKDLLEDRTEYSDPHFSKNVSQKIFDDFEIYIVSAEKGAAQAALLFYLPYIRSVHGNPSVIPLVETALFLSFEAKDQAAFDELYSLYKSFQNLEFSDDPDYIRYHDCRFLIQEFERRARSEKWKIDKSP